MGTGNYLKSAENQSYGLLQQNTRLPLIIFHEGQPTQRNKIISLHYILTKTTDMQEERRWKKFRKASNF